MYRDNIPEKERDYADWLLKQERDYEYKARHEQDEALKITYSAMAKAYKQAHITFFEDVLYESDWD